MAERLGANYQLQKSMAPNATMKVSAEVNAVSPKTFFASTIFAGGHPQAALAVYQGTVDGAATFIDARDSLVATIDARALGAGLDRAKALEFLARRPGSRIPTVGQWLGDLMRPRIGRVLVLLGWWWLGWHYFAR